MATPTTQEMLDAVKTAIKSILDGGAVASYSIGGRNLQHYSLRELMDLQKELQAGLAAEKGKRRTYVQFERPS